MSVRKDDDRMYCTQTFSLLTPDEGGERIIKNIIVADDFELANRIANRQYGCGAIAIDTTDYPVRIGDIWKDGVFYHLGAVVPKNPSYDEQIAELRQSNIKLQNDIAELLMLILEKQEEYGNGESWI